MICILFKIIYFFKRNPFVFLTFLIVGSWAIVKLLFILFPIKEMKPNSNWIESVGTITKYALGKNGHGYMKYKIGNTYYNVRNDIGNYGMVLGEKYNILVNPIDHYEYLMKTWEPVFTPNEKTGFCTGRITRVYAFNWKRTDSFSTNHGIEYEYKVLGSIYNRAQDLPPEYKNIYRYLRKEDSFKVEYLIINPQRSRMFFPS